MPVFGYPITSTIEETIEGQTYTVQYFERRRMELHQQPDGHTNVLLGLLGNVVRQELVPVGSAAYPQCLDGMNAVMQQAHRQVPAPEVLGCPDRPQRTDIPAAIQRFERGEMIWLKPGIVQAPAVILPSTILAYIQNPAAPHPTFAGPFTDRWLERQDPDYPDVTPPAGYYAPWRGFGKVWVENPELAEALGWARDPESHPRRADYQVMTGGVLVRLYEEGTTGVVYAFGNPDIPTQVRKVTP